MKKIWIAVIALLLFLLIAMLFSGKAFASMAEDGFAMPMNNGLVEKINGSGERIPLTALYQDDIIYRSPLGYHVGKQRHLIDITYPMYVNGGAVLRFWSEENWMFTAGVELFRSFTGQYLSEGISYNADLSQADDVEFILVTLPNGLYMNAQAAEFHGPLGSVSIPLNSIIQFSEEAIRWYAYDGGILRFFQEEAVFGATITIGDNTYRYESLLDALGLIRKAIESSSGPRVDAALEQEAYEILNKGTVNRDNGPKGPEEDKPEDPNNNRRPSGEDGGKNPSAGTPGDKSEGESSSGANADGSGGASGNTGAPGTGTGKPGGQTPNKPSTGTGGGSTSQPGGGNQGGNNTGTGTPPPGSQPPDGYQYPDGGNTDGGNNNNPGGGTAVPPKYQDPEITISNIKPWSYAVGLDLKVNDRAGALYRGISFSVYREIQGSGATGTTEEGIKTYSQAGYSGRSKILGRTRYSSESMALATLDPGTTIYLQFNYRYNVPIDGTGENGTQQQYERRSYYSDLYEIKLPTVAEGNVQPIAADWDTVFAASETAMQLTGLTIANTSNYQEDAETFSFENFCLNTLPYVDHLEFTLRKPGASDVTIQIGSTVLQRAQNDGGVSFLSTVPLLQSNSCYTYTDATVKVVAKDRNGNEIALDYSAHDNGSGDDTIYTRKATPKVTIVEQENIMDKLTLTIQVSDPDHALVNESLIFSMKDLSGNVAYLYGTWDTAQVSPGGNTTEFLELYAPTDGKTYTIALESLAFSRMYNAQVTGSYEPQPDNSAHVGTIPGQEDQLLGSNNFYTASLSSGRIGFSTSYSELKDTSVTINATMNDATTVDILPLVDALRFKILDPAGNVVTQVELDKETLSGTGFAYDSESATLVIQEKAGMNPGISLYGTASQLRPGQDAYNPWDSMFIGTYHDPEDGLSYTNPMEIRLDFPEGTLTNNTSYTYAIEAVVTKGSEEFYIQVEQSGNSFTTKKTLPRILYSDLFLAADRAEFLNLRIYDPDQTILENGLVRAYLYYNSGGTSTLLSAQDIFATQDPNAAGEDLKFSGLISGGSYTLKFIAPSYNDAEGYGSYDPNHLLAAYEIVGGSELQGTLKLNTLSTNEELPTDEQLFTAGVDVSVNDVRGYLGREGETGQIQLVLWRSDSMTLPEYGTEPYLTITRDLTKNADGSLSLTESIDFTDLPSMDNWKLVLKTTYQGRPVLLDEITFNTDSSYIVVDSHEDLIAAQMETNQSTGKRDYNILVVSNFTQKNLSPVTNYYGNIDFQGHVVTKGTDVTVPFLDVNPGCKVSNLVYDYPNQSEYTNSSTIFYTSNGANFHGTVENLIVRTYGQIEAKSGLISGYMEPGSTLRNFIVRLGGDVTVQGDGYRGALVSSVSGTIENGYVYGVNGAGLICRTAVNGAGLFGYISAPARIRHLFFAMDSWIQTNTNNRLFSGSNYNLGDLSGVYSVGDFFSIELNEAKHRRNYYEDQHLIRSEAYPSIYSDFWAISSRSYTTPGNAGRAVTSADVALLRDTDWQAARLGSAFDINDPVSMGFYPRLNLPASMQRYQEYLYLPEVSGSIRPQIISAAWATGEYALRHEADGNILLRLKNTNNARITNVTIPGLKTTVVTDFSNGEFYDVILGIEVDEEAATASTANIGYVSTHTVESITYHISGSTQTITSGFEMRSIDLWKPVATVEDWFHINQKMGWNYKLTADLDFSGSNISYHMMTIDGSTSSHTGTTSFTGRLDGQEHTIRGISLENVTYASIIYYASYAEIRNLFFEDITLSCAATSAGNRCGIIGYSNYSTVENVRLRSSEPDTLRSSITGSTYVGGIVGYSNNGTIDNCSVVDSSIIDRNTGSPLYMGGIVGYLHDGNMANSYTRDLRMTVDQTTVVNGAGGLAGYQRGSITDCYAHGVMQIAGNYVGGISGSSTTSPVRCWSYMDIRHSGGNYVAGLVGTRGASVTHNITLGNISTTATDLDRTGSTGSYYYAGQLVSGFAADEAGPKNSVPLTAEQLSRPDIWQDTVQLGSAYDYSPLTLEDGACAPLLVSDTDVAGWTQQYIPLPGLGSSASLALGQCVYSGGKYIVNATLHHPNISHADVKPLLTITMDGMDISQAQQEAGNVVLNVTAATSEENSESSSISITIDPSVLTKALDVYTLTVKYTNGGRTQEVSSVVEFVDATTGEVIHIYWDIDSLQKWNDMMGEHGSSSENFRITEVIDFTTDTVSLNDLVLNRLEGVITTVTDEATGTSTTTTSGFTNLTYDASSEGTPWIRKVAMGVKNLSFTNMTYSFSGTTTARAMTGAFINTGALDNLTLTNVQIYGNHNTRKYFGFISNASGDISNCTLDNVLLQDKAPSTTGNGDYCGGLVAYTKNSLTNLTGTNITIIAPYCNNTGGFVGRVENNELASANGITLSGMYIKGRTYTGGAVGYYDANHMSEVTVTGSTAISTVPNEAYNIVTGYSAVGGVLGYSSAHRKTGVNYEITGMNVTATNGSAGGLNGSTGWHMGQYVTVSNCNVTGTTFVGGIKAGGPSYYYDAVVENCTVLNNSTSTDRGPTVMATGGLHGNFNGCDGQTPSIYGCVVRNTTVTGPANVGGAVGAIIRLKQSDNYNHVYVGKDVTVTAVYDSAGGLVGTADTLNFNDSGSGAVVSANNNAGGIIGRVIPRDGVLRAQFHKLYFRGSVTATLEYAGGVVGKVEEGLEFTDSTLDNIAVAANITATSKASTWANSTTSALPGTGYVYIWDGSTVNGETVTNIQTAATAEGRSVNLAPNRLSAEEVMIRPASDFQTDTFYTTTLGFGTASWIISDAITAGYMPYPRGYKDDSTPLVSASVTADAATLILLPQGTGTATTTVSPVAYVSGINSINVEFPRGTAEMAVSLNPTATTPVIYYATGGGPVTIQTTVTDSLTYFCAPVTTGEDGTKTTGAWTSYTASGLTRNIMTYGNCWYYTTSTGIQWGTDTAASSTLIPLTGITHLWQGMATDGTNYYRLTETVDANNVITGITSTAITAPTAAESSPYWKTTTPQIDVFYYYSTYADSDPLPFRAFYTGNQTRTVTADQGIVHDGVLATFKSATKQEFFVLLEEDSGKLISYGNTPPAYPNGFLNNQIVQMSNSQGYTGNALVVRYSGGGIHVFNYLLGSTLSQVTTQSQAEVFAAWVSAAVGELFSFGGEEGLYADSSLTDADQLYEQMASTGLMELPSGEYGMATDVGAPPENALSATGGGAIVTTDGDDETESTGGGVNAVSGSATQSGSATGGSTGGGSVGGGGGTDGNMTTEEAMKALFGDAAAVYSSETGQYELYPTASLASGKPERIDKDQNKDDKKQGGKDEKEKDSSFQVAQAGTISLLASEERGLFLIILSGSVGLIALMLIFWNIIKRNSR